MVLFILGIALMWAIKHIIWGGCEICNKNMGAFKGLGWNNKCCSEECEKERYDRRIRFGDRVKIIIGGERGDEFEGMQGKINSMREKWATSIIGRGGRTQYYGYKVLFDNGNEELIDEWNMEKIR